ncbi:MAG: hypothetical protein E7325_07660 [Clostridiales bacterium]|nr:hypothetical protein [Clostridiales bacterium]
MKKILSLLLVLAMLCCGVSAFAEEPAGETFVSPDGVLSIQAPTAQWRALSSPGCWFLIGDESSYILIDHLSNGEALPPVSVAGGDHAAVYQAYISNRNEVFTVFACSDDETALPGIIRAIGSIQILTPNTVTALPSAETAESGSAYANAPFAVYAQDGSVVFIFLNADKTLCLDRLGNHYSNVRGDLYYCIEQDKLYHADRNYWVQQESEAVASSPFTVYPLEGNPVVIHRTESGKYVDDAGHIYYQTANVLYVREDNNVTYSADPDYWNYSDLLAEKDAAEAESNAAAAAPFTVYPLDGDPVVIYRTESGSYTDAAGRTYYQTANGLYVCDNNNVTYSADPDYWNYSDLLAERDAAEAESNAAAAAPFTVYPLDGDPVVIYRTESGSYTDAYGRTYYQTANGLYVCDNNNVTYSADPDYWDYSDLLAAQDEADEIMQNAREREADGEVNDDDLNAQDDEDEILQHARDLEEYGEVNPDDLNAQDDEDEILQHARDLEEYGEVNPDTLPENN